VFTWAASNMGVLVIWARSRGFQKQIKAASWEERAFKSEGPFGGR